MSPRLPRALRSPSAELVPLTARARYLQLVRVALVVAVLALAAAQLHAAGHPTPPRVWASLLPQAAVGVGHLLLTAAASALVLCRSRAVAHTAWSAALLLDGLYLAWVTGAGAVSDVASAGLVVVHVVATTLLSSFRTGLKIALWHSLVALVVLRSEETGLLVLSDRAAGPRSTAELAVVLVVLWLAVLTTAAGAAVNERELRRRRLDAEELQRLGTALQQPSTLEELDDALASFAVEWLGARRVAVVRRHGDHLRARGRRLGAPGPVRDAALLEAAAAAGQRLVTHVDARRDPWLVALLPDARRVVVLPLPGGRGGEGLVVESSVRRGSRIEVRVLDTARQALVQASLAQSRIAALQQLREAAATDGLTGLANRRTLDAELATAVALTSAAGQACSLLVVDLDHFKRVNDVHGHQAGDDVLRAVGAVLADLFADGGLPARYGGEEFAVLLPGVPARQAAVRAGQVRRALRALRLVVPVTASIGVAELDGLPDVATLVARADAALYEAKEGGRDRVVVAGAPDGARIAGAARTSEPVSG